MFHFEHRFHTARSRQNGPAPAGGVEGRQEVEGGLFPFLRIFVRCSGRTQRGKSLISVMYVICEAQLHCRHPRAVAACCKRATYMHYRILSVKHTHTHRVAERSSNLAGFHQRFLCIYSTHATSVAVRRLPLPGAHTFGSRDRASRSAR